MDANWVVIGMGPGGPDYVTAAARDALRSARFVCGSQPLLQKYLGPAQTGLVIDADLDALQQRLSGWLAERVAFLVSGDPGFYSILDWLRREFPGQRMAVVPGISSMQLAFARLGQSWYDCKFLSLHGRDGVDFLTELRHNRQVCLLTDERRPPAAIIAAVAAHFPKRRVFVGSRLGTAEEATWQGTAGAYQDGDPNHPYSVVIVADAELAL
ncbi:precorrin-6Y C5,15-methyltransferase (decarboxylating) [Hydrogenispora ethanolica]|uniref:Precorrin-6Y C5,15-methyltransferase (Decarboxylating) n=1 Tax=Hydrogenispora ethanolica TaxID=1082276 RepID=A0A4R1S5N5_HYDET|nr:precorrin-6y C5,15-methyltransferase (decarboxylating) subunit CbiE [Hydrogenispora ethanolica]TCL74070.1 precorrin-6Y C5,15-methyltransferase (decarboxylating) [Hydrogenispora ethanolica]